MCGDGGGRAADVSDDGAGGAPPPPPPPPCPLGGTAVEEVEPGGGVSPLLSALCVLHCFGLSYFMYLLCICYVCLVSRGCRRRIIVWGIYHAIIC